MRSLEEIKADLAKSEKMLAIAIKQNAIEVVMKNAESKVAKYKAELEELEKDAEKAVEKAEKKAEEAETKSEKKEAKKEVKEAKEEVKEVEKVAEKVEKVAEKVDKAIEKSEKATKGGAREGSGRPKVIGRMEKPKGTWGGSGRGAGRMPKRKKTMPVPTNVKQEKLAISKRTAAKSAKAKADAKIKTARAFGQVIEYKNDAEFCSKLKAAFKKRRAAAKANSGKRRKTKPVFGVITTSVKNAVSKALHSVPTKEIEKNPKQFLVKAERLEKSAIRFLEDFKSILGNDYKKSEITSEFGELEKAIKQFVAKVTK
jgi:hypothetical protein